MIGITLIAGLLGGLTCAAISKNRTTGLVFAVIIVVLSFVFAVPAIMKDHTPVARSGDVPNLQAMQMAQPPAWLCIINPILAGAGVLVGTRVKKSPAA